MADLDSLEEGPGMKKGNHAMRLALVSVGALCLNSCYVTVQGSRYLSLLTKAVPEDKVLANPDAAESSKELLERVIKIRQFAENTLGLKDTKNYKALVEMNADRLATIVSACDELSFDRYLWHYPVVGALPYKGFFKPEEAEKEASRLMGKGLDVIIRPVDAFSTLGWFADPLFSFMSKYDDAELAETIIHELTHATIFVKKAEQFNEEFATFVGRRAALLSLKSVYGEESPELKNAQRSRSDSDAFSAFLRGTADALQPIYAANASREEKLERKAQILAARAKEYKKTAPFVFSQETYKVFPMEKINNAYLDLYRLYEGEPALYQDYLDKICNGDLAAFIRRVAELAVQGGDPKVRMWKYLTHPL